MTRAINCDHCDRTLARQGAWTEQAAGTADEHITLSKGPGPAFYATESNTFHFCDWPCVAAWAASDGKTWAQLRNARQAQ